MTGSNPGDWPDAARELVEWALAVHFSGNRMPHMSGDPRNRLAPGRRRAMEDARDAVLEALAPTLTQVMAERDRLRKALERAADTLSDASLLDAWADARTALGETGHD